MGAESARSARRHRALYFTWYFNGVRRPPDSGPRQL